MLLNHFAISSDIQLFRTTYRHHKPNKLAGYLRSQGFRCAVSGEHVIVLHGTFRPNAKAKAVEHNLPITPEDDQFEDALLSAIVHALHRDEFVLDKRDRQAFHPSRHIVPLTTPKKTTPLVAVNAHLSWQWELEQHSGQRWLVLRPGRMFLSSAPLTDAALRLWMDSLPTSVTALHAVDIEQGSRCRLERSDGVWLGRLRRRLQPLEGAWRLSFSMENLAELELSSHAFHVAQIDMPALCDFVASAGPWCQFIEAVEPLVADGTGIEGQKLRFGRRFGREVGDIHKFGILKPPSKPVRLAVVVPRLVNEEAQKTLRQVLLAHLINRKRMRNNRDVEAGVKLLNIKDDNDSLYTLWSAGHYGLKFGLPPFDVVPGLHMYDPNTGELEAKHGLQDAAADAKGAGRFLLGFTVLPEYIEKQERDRLFKQLAELGIRRIVPVNIDSLRAGFFVWKTLAVRLAQRAGAVPWDLHDLPGVHENTFFLGIDLGHNHQEDASILALALHDYRGRPIKCDARKLERNSERIPLQPLEQMLARVLPPKVAQNARLIVHRDGRYLPGEVHDILMACSDNGIEDVSLVAIKKDSLSVASDVVEGNYLNLDERRCLLVTSTQAEGSSVPKPIEVELVAPGQLSLRETTEQVFWLSRVFMDSAQHPKRLPATTHWANGIARSGRRVPLDGWRHG